jgi:DNA-binding response OmpR family regulator
MRALIVEDDKEIRELLEMSLRSEGYVVDSTDDGERGSYIARVNSYDVILLDILLPSKNGPEICKELRAHGIITPIIIISVRTDPGEKAILLDSGADDFISKPFSTQELLARIRAVIRRPKTIDNPVLQIEDLSLDRDRQQVTRGKKRIYLTKKEFSLLECLMRQKGKVVSRGVILENVWGTDIDPFSNTIEAHILNLRKKIDYHGVKKLIHSVPSRGYKIDTAR